jgi:hypothetical protein
LAHADPARPRAPPALAAAGVAPGMPPRPRLGAMESRASSPAAPPPALAGAACPRHASRLPSTGEPSERLRVARPASRAPLALLRSRPVPRGSLSPPPAKGTAMSRPASWCPHPGHLMAAPGPATRRSLAPVCLPRSCPPTPSTSSPPSSLWCRPIPPLSLPIIPLTVCHSPPSPAQTVSSSSQGWIKIPSAREQRFSSIEFWCRLRATKTLTH